jgi:hypothetical protein
VADVLGLIRLEMARILRILLAPNSQGEVHL